jgi:hypothetical protein
VSTDFTLTKQGIIRNAYQMAGIVMPGAEPDSAQSAFGSDLLNTRIKALQSEGIILVTMERVTMALTEGTASYDLAADTLDVDPGTPYVTGNSINVPMEWYSRAMYMALTVPDTLGQPTSIYIEKTSTITAHLYPVPDSGWTTMTLPVVKLLSDLTTGNSVTGLQAKYLRTFVFGVAADLALAHGLMGPYAALNAKFEEEKMLAVRDDTQRGNLTFIADYGYNGGWGWGRGI